MEGRNQFIFAIAAGVAAGAISCYHWFKQLRTTAQVRARSQDPAGTFDEEVEQWLSKRLSARWLIEAAHTAAQTSMQPEAIDFYNRLAEKWNDEIGWAERRLITTSNEHHRRHG
jgi:hypothetical protein